MTTRDTHRLHRIREAHRAMEASTVSRELVVPPGSRVVMRAAWYDRRGPARDVLVAGDLADPQPGAGRSPYQDQCVRNQPRRRREALGRTGCPHAVSAGQSAQRRCRRHRRGRPGCRRPAAQATGVVLRRPVVSAVRSRRPVLSSSLTRSPWRYPTPPTRDVLDQAACLGIAGITAYRALFADGPIGGLNVLVYGAAGGVGSIVTQFAGTRWRPRHGRRAYLRATGRRLRVGCAPGLPRRGPRPGRAHPHGSTGRRAPHCRDRLRRAHRPQRTDHRGRRHH